MGKYGAFLSRKSEDTYTTMYKQAVFEIFQIQVKEKAIAF